MAKMFRNKFALWTAGIYLFAVLVLGIFSVGSAFLASTAIKGLFFTLILPLVITTFIVNFFTGYWAGLLIEKIWRKIK